jgi:short-subunit dehydrogenase
MDKCFHNKVTLITGASSGIGEALARELAQRKARLCLIARRGERLASLKAELENLTEVMIMTCDVTDEVAMRQSVEMTLNHFGRLDLVIANAGRGVSGAINQLSIEAFRGQFETNVFGVLNTVYPAMKALQDSKGQLVILGSIMSYLAFGGSAPYSMSKFAVRALAEALYHEWKPLGVSVTLICPGFVESEIRQVDNRGKFHPELKDPVSPWLKMPKAVAARKILKATASRKRELILTGHGRLGVAIKSWFPGLFHGIVDAFNIRSGNQKARL